MPCCLVLLLLVLGPRVILALIFFTSRYLEHAYHQMIIPLIGFFFLPWTTLAYAWIINNGHRVEGIYLVALIVTVAIDLGAHGGGYQRSRQN